MRTLCSKCGRISRSSPCATCQPVRRKPYVRVIGWAAKRARQLRREPICETEIDGVRCTARATDVDHDVPLSRGGRDDPSNYKSRCHEHHSRKTAIEFNFGRVAVARTERRR